MTFKKNTTFNPEEPPVPAPNSGGEAPTKCSLSSDVRSTVLDPYSPDPMTTLALPYAVPRNTPTHVYTNTSVDPTEEFKNSINDIIEAITFLTDPISYEP